MDPPDLEIQDAVEIGGRPSDPAGADPGDGWLEEIVARLEADPEERWPAIESLSAVDDETRRLVVEALAAYGDRPGVRDLLDLLGSARNPTVRGAAAVPAPLPAVRADRDGALSPSDPVSPPAGSSARL